MVAVSRLLDPDAQNSELRAYAFLQARYVTGAKNAVDCLQPVVEYAISHSAGREFDIETTGKFLSENYQLSIPYYMIESMVPALQKRGVLVYDEILKVNICGNLDAIAEGDHADLGFKLDDIEEAGESLERYAVHKGQESPFASRSWSEAIISFFRSDSNERKPVSKEVGGVIIRDAGQLDGRIVADFILHTWDNNREIYNTIEKIYYGVLVAEFLTNLEKTGDPDNFNTLSVIYDTTVLMRLLGTSGRKLRTATMEMHRTLQDIGCNTFYFGHNLTELEANLQYILEAHSAGKPIYPETQEALRNGEISLSEIAILIRIADREFGNLTITEHPTRYEEKTDGDQIDEVEFSNILHRSGSPTYTRFAGTAASYDAQSLALTVRIRDGLKPRDVSKSRAIFVTHNSFLASRSSRFLRDTFGYSARTIGAVMTVGQMTTLAWMANEIDYESGLVSKELAANCYLALIPRDGWDNAFWDAIEKIDRNTAGEDLKEILHSDVARGIALEITHGVPNLFKSVDYFELARRANLALKDGRRKSHKSGFQAGQKRVSVKLLSKAADLSQIAAIQLIFFLKLVFVLGPVDI